MSWEVGHRVQKSQCTDLLCLLARDDVSHKKLDPDVEELLQVDIALDEGQDFLRVDHEESVEHGD